MGEWGVVSVDKELSRRTLAVQGPVHSMDAEPDMNDRYVRNRVIVITGGSRGIGLAVARALVKRGARVAILARNATAVEAAVETLGRERAVGLVADVCKRYEIEAALAIVVERWGRIDGIVNNVGFQFARRIELMPEDEVRRLVDLNFLSAVFCCQAVIPLLRRAGGGRIVNISSSTVRHDNEFCHLALYSSSKAALEQFTRELRAEVKTDGIMVSLVSPGPVATGSVANFDHRALSDAMAAWMEKGPMSDGIMEAVVIGEAIAHCFEYPPGVALEFMEVRPNVPTPKALEPQSDCDAVQQRKQ
jgi:NAD(P)-dependent dehydrogenase (short-subunit alcohol dehydrogenase family)